MSVIGQFTKKDDRYTGTIRTMTINVKTQIVRNNHKLESRDESNGAPDYRLFAGGAELGAGWSKSTEDGRPYVAIKLDDPSFDKPVRAAFFEDEEKGTGILVWNRAKPQPAAART